MPLHKIMFIVTVTEIRSNSKHDKYNENKFERDLSSQQTWFERAHNVSELIAAVVIATTVVSYVFGRVKTDPCILPLST